MLDRETQTAIREAEKAWTKQRQVNESLWGLISCIHADPKLREFVTLESQPLKPYVYPLSEGAGQVTENLVATLLAVPVAKPKEHFYPWGLVIWEWPSRQLIGLLNLRFGKAFGDKQQNQTFSSEMIATEDFANALQLYLEKGGVMPEPPELLANVYRAVIHAIAKAQNDAYQALALAPPIDQIQSNHNHRPTPRSININALLARSFELFRDSGNETLFQAWKILQRRLQQPHFSVAVAGEFSRGKTTLINKLLGRELLPVGDTPTTALLTRVTFGESEALWHMNTAEEGERLPLTEETWEKLTAQNHQGNESQGMILVHSPDPWLQSSRLDLLDTPGTNDVFGVRGALTAEAIAGCDATLVAISATNALSMTERLFIEQHILAHHIPHVAVVVTRLDQVPSRDHNRIFDYLALKLQELAPQAALWCSQAVDHAAVPVSGAEAIREALTRWAGDPRRTHFRNRQIAAQLQALLQIYRKGLETARHTAVLSEQERQASIKAAEIELSRRKLQWEDLRQSLRSRELELGRWFGATLQQRQGDMLDTLNLDLSHAGNPRSWWEIDLPFRLNREMAGLARQIEEHIQRSLAQDAHWLQRQIKERFTWNFHAPQQQEKGQAPSLAVEETDIGDIQTQRLLSRLGFGTATVGAYLLFGPLGMAISIAGGIVSEKVMLNTLSHQRDELRSCLKPLVEQICLESKLAFCDRLSKIYKAMLEEMYRQEQLWFQTQLNALKKPTTNSEPASQEIEKKLQEVQGILKSIAQEWSGEDQ